MPVQDEMSQLVRQFDWHSTPLGAPSSWNKSFQAVVDLCLRSKSPMLLVGGKELIQIYNTSFSAIIGSRHPAALGARAKEFWADQWSEIGPIVRKVWDEGESILIENHRFVLTRKGYPEEMFFTTSYTPVIDTSGIQGILVTITETTQLIRKDQHLKYLRNQLVSNLFMQAPLALCMLQGPDMIIEIANEEMLRLVGRTADQIINKPAFEAIPEVANMGFESLIRKVYVSGEKEVIPEVSVTINRWGEPEELFIKMVYEPVREIDNTISGIMVLAEEITEEVTSRKKTEESEIRHKLAIEAASIGTFDWDMINSIFLMSDRLANIFGFSDASEVTHQSLIERVHPQDRAVREKAHQDAASTGSLSYEARITWPDNSTHWVRINGKVVYDDHGTPYRMYGTALDITDQRVVTERLEDLVKQRSKSLNQRTAQLKSSEERYHKMIEEVQDYAIILLDKNGIIQNWNKGAEHIKGFKEQEVVGKHFSIFYLDEDKENNLPEKLLHEAFSNGRAMHEGLRLRKDGSRFWGSVVMTALHDDQNNIIGFTKVTRDLTERKIAEEKMLAYTLELEAQNKELEQFAYIASHDLQEPLRKIRTFTELLQHNLHDELTTKRYFDKINASAHRMSDLIKSVLAYSKISKEGDLWEPVDLNVVLTSVMTDFELLIEEKKATIIREILPSIHGVSGQLNQLFSNLISNALKFTRVSPVIRVTSRILSIEEVANEPTLLPSLTYVEISIADNGIGFDQQYEKKIFTMFQRLHRKEQYAGTGIGLALCKKIVENHNGMIAAKSIQGIGTTFFITLPDNPQSFSQMISNTEFS